MLDGDPFLAYGGSGPAQRFGTSTLQGGSARPLRLYSGPAAPPRKPTFTLLGTASISADGLPASRHSGPSRGKENAPSGLAPSPRLVLASSSSIPSSSSSSSSSSVTRSGNRTDALRRPRRVTFSPTPLPSLQSSPAHKRGADLSSRAGEGAKRRRTSGVYSNNPLFLSAREAAAAEANYSSPPLEWEASSSSPTTSPPSLLFSPVGSGESAATPPSTALRVCTTTAPPRSPPRPPHFCPFSLAGRRSPPTPRSSRSGGASAAGAEERSAAAAAAALAGGAEGDAATDSETESDAVQSLLLPNASPAAAAAAVTLGGVRSPSGPIGSQAASVWTLSSSSPLPSPSRPARTPTWATTTSSSSSSSTNSSSRPALRSILKPRPRTPGAIGTEKEALRRNARGKKHVASWDGERKALALALRTRRMTGGSTAGGGCGSNAAATSALGGGEEGEGGKGARGRGEGRGVAREAVWAGRTAAAAAAGPSGGLPAAAPLGQTTRGSRAAGAGRSAAAGSRGPSGTASGGLGGGGSGGRDEDDEDQQRRRRLNAGFSAGAPQTLSSSSSASSSSASASAAANAALPGAGRSGGTDETQRIVHDLDLDDPVHFLSPLLTLRASLRPGSAFPAVALTGYDGSAPSLPPRPHPAAPYLLDEEAEQQDDLAPTSSRRRQRFAAPTLLTDVEEAYVLLTHAAFRLPPGDLPNPIGTFEPLRTFATVLVRALTRDIGNMGTFAEWADKQAGRSRSAAAHPGSSSPLRRRAEEEQEGEGEEEELGGLGPTPSPPQEEAGLSPSAKKSLTEEQMRRLRDELGAAQAAVKCAAALFRDVRIVALFDDAMVSDLVRLVASTPLIPSLSGLVQQNLLPLVPFFLRSIHLPASLLEPLVLPTLLPSLAATLALPQRIDRHRFILGESISALTALLPLAPSLPRLMLADEAWRGWLPACVRGLWDGPKKGTSVRDRAVKLLGRVVRALTVELDDQPTEEERKWAVEREAVAEAIGEELQKMFNAELPEPHSDPEVKTWLDLLSKQLDAVQQPGPDGEDPGLSARLGIISLLSVLPPLMRSSFRRMQQKMVPKEGGVGFKLQQGIGPWLRPINQMQIHPDSTVLVLSTLAWSHLAFAFCGTVSPKGLKSWVLRMPDRRPFLVFSNILESRKELWQKHAPEEEEAAAAEDATIRDQRREHAHALTLALSGIAYGATVHILYGSSAERDPTAPIDPPTSPRKLEQLDFVCRELLRAYLPCATASPPVSASVAALGWQLLSNLVRPRTREDQNATLERLVNSAFLEGSLAQLTLEKRALLVASAMERAVQPSDLPAWGRTWVTTRVDTVLELFEACLPVHHEPEPLVEAAIADTWRSLLLTLRSEPASLQSALVWLARNSSTRSSHVGIVANLWNVTLALDGDEVVQEIRAALDGRTDALQRATTAWLAGEHDRPEAFADALVSSWTTALASARPEDVSIDKLDAVVRLLRLYADADPGSAPARSSGGKDLARAVNQLLWQDHPAASILSSHLASLVTAPTDVTSDLNLITLLVSASEDLDVEAQDNVLALAEHAVQQILSGEAASSDNLALIARLLEIAPDGAFPSLYDRVLQLLAGIVRPTSEDLRHFSSLLAPSLSRAYKLSLANEQASSLRTSSTSPAQQSLLLHPTHRPILAFDTFWKATFGHAETDLDIPENMVELLSIMREISAGFNVPGLGDTQDTASLLRTSAPAAAQVGPTHPRLTRTTATTSAQASGRGYAADRSGIPTHGRHLSSSTDSSFTPGSANQAAASLSLQAPAHGPETQVVDETPKDVEMQRARESFAALTSQATGLGVESDEGGLKRRRSERDEREIVAATDEEETPRTKEPLKRKAAAKRSRASQSAQKVPVVVELQPASKKRVAPVDTPDVGGPKKRRKGATTRSRSRSQTESVSPAPSASSSSEVSIIENSQPTTAPAAVVSPPAAPSTVTDSQEETVRRFFALPLDTVIEAGKRLGGSPSLKRLMDLGERAKEYFERASSQSSSQ